MHSFTVLTRLQDPLSPAPCLLRRTVDSDVHLQPHLPCELAHRFPVFTACVPLQPAMQSVRQTIARTSVSAAEFGDVLVHFAHHQLTIALRVLLR